MEKCYEAALYRSNPTWPLHGCNAMATLGLSRAGVPLYFWGFSRGSGRRGSGAAASGCAGSGVAGGFDGAVVDSPPVCGALVGGASTMAGASEGA